MEHLGIGMIGCGEIAVKTAAAIAESAYARHVMVMDARAELAQDLGERYGVPWTDGVDRTTSTRRWRSRQPRLASRSWSKNRSPSPWPMPRS